MKCFSLLLGLAFGLPAAPVYTITNLGTLPGTTYSIARGVNDNGVVVGQSGTQQFRWSGGVMSAIPGVSNGTAWAINNNGHIVGVEGSGGFYFNGVSSAPVGPVGATAYDINNSNVIVGVSGSGAWQSVAGAAASILVDFGTLSTSAEANAINDSGQIAGAAYLAGGPPYSKHPTLWTALVPQDLGTLLAGSSSSAADVNGLGQVVGGTPVGSGVTQAFIWSGGVMTTLGTLGRSNERAQSINDAGVIVGYSAGGGVSRAFVYDGTGMFDLNNLLANGAGWTLETAYSINASGQIVGQGFFNGELRGFLLTPSAVPEPSTWAMLASGLALGWIRARRRQ